MQPCGWDAVLRRLPAAHAVAMCWNSCCVAADLRVGYKSKYHDLQPTSSGICISSILGIQRCRDACQQLQNNALGTIIMHAVAIPPWHAACFVLPCNCCTTGISGFGFSNNLLWMGIDPDNNAVAATHPGVVFTCVNPVAPFTAPGCYLQQVLGLNLGGPLAIDATPSKA